MRILFCSLCVLDIALAVQLVVGDKGIMEYLQLCTTRDQLRTQIDATATRNMVLSDEIRLLKKSPAYVEQMARAEFNFVAEGEILYLFEPSSGKDQPSGQRR
ncbi:FtsB family cell division protein [Desulfoplanes sp. PS50]